MGQNFGGAQNEIGPYEPETDPYFHMKMDKMVQMANLKGPIWFTLRITGRHVPPRPPLKYAYVNNRFNLISKPKTSLWHGKEKYASIVFYATACCRLYYSMTLVTLL